MHCVNNVTVLPLPFQLFLCLNKKKINKRHRICEHLCDFGLPFLLFQLPLGPSCMPEHALLLPWTRETKPCCSAAAAVNVVARLLRSSLASAVLLLYSAVIPMLCHHSVRCRCS